jgi:prepilin-type processing-associated H-X9-DG protein
MSVTDLTGGLGVEAEYGLRDQPDIALMREGVSVWVYDDAGRFGLPRIALEAIGPDWDKRKLQVNVAFADGRVVIGSCDAEAGPREDADGALSIFTGGGLEFRCLEPFRRWSVRFDGPALDTTEAQTAIRTTFEEPQVRLQFELEVEMVVPPWITGTMLPDAGEALDGADAKFVGGRRSAEGAMRYEQLFRSKGRLAVGDEEWTFDGSGLRIHRQGLRNLGEFTGHVWQSAVFPSGKAFGYMWLLPFDYKEGFVYEDGEMLPARIIQAPFMTQMLPPGEDVSVVLETERGRTEIRGETAYSVFIRHDEPFWTERENRLEWQQGGVKFTWDGESAYGMIERSTLPEAMEA